MNLKTLTLIGFILIFLTVSCVSADGNFTELQDNIDSSDKTLELDKNYTYYSYKDDPDRIHISNLTVNGNNHEITCGESHGFNVSGNVTFNDISFIAGNTTINGECENLIINNCSFTFNQKGVYIDVVCKNITISNSRFVSDKYFVHDFALINAESVNIINTTFTNVEDGLCRALYLNADEFKIINSTFSNLNADIGSAILTKRGRGTIINSKFLNNRASFRGGAIYSDSQMELIGCEFTNNCVYNAQIDPDDGLSAGAVYLNANGNMIKGCKFSDNYGVYLAGAIYINGDDTVVRDSVFEGNEAGCATIYWHANRGSLINSTFKNNPGDYASAVLWDGSNGLISGSTFYFDLPAYPVNTLVEWKGANGRISDSKFFNKNQTSIQWDGSDGAVDGCEFDSNRFYSLVWNGGNGKLTNSRFSGCGFCVYWQGNSAFIDNCQFTKNTEQCIHLLADNGKISNSKFTYNTVFLDVVEVSGRNSIVEKCEFLNNDGRQYGAIRWNAANGKIQNNVFKYNTAKWGDAAISVGDNYLKICKNNVFYQNFPEEIVVIPSIPLKIYYNSGQKMTVKIIKKNSGAPIVGAEVSIYLDVQGNNRFKAKTNSKGIATITGLSKVTEFGHRVNDMEIKLPVKKYYSNYDSNYEVDLSKYTYFTRFDLKEYDFGIEFKKCKCTVKSPKITSKHNKNKYFKITVKNKFTKKAIKNLKLKLKVFTGKKYKAYTVKTNKKGVAKFNVKNLSRGTHKVEIKSKNYYYYVNAKSSIKIK